ncbi:MAG: hypothetical protein LUD39_04570 [Opitutae bacterium]|nr:hypothetical protein [Opitutae bacterium]
MNKVFVAAFCLLASVLYAEETDYVAIFNESPENSCLSFYTLKVVREIVGEKVDSEDNPHLLPDKKFCKIFSNFAPTENFKNLLERKFDNDFALKRADSMFTGNLPAIDIYLRAKTQFAFKDWFSSAGERIFHFANGDKSVEFIKSTSQVRAKFSENQNGFYLSFPLSRGKVNAKSDFEVWSYDFEIWQMKNPSATREELSELKNSAREEFVEILLPRVDTQCKFDFLKVLKGEFVCGIHPTELLRIIEAKEDTAFQITESGLTFSSKLTMKLRGIGVPSGKDPVRTVIISEPFYFAVSTQQDTYCFGKISRF